MAIEIFFIYDTHCPWSYAATPLVTEINRAFPRIKLHLWHNAYYDGETTVDIEQVKDIEKIAGLRFSARYFNTLASKKDSTLCANIMNWATNKTPHQALALLTAIQDEHFAQGNELNDTSKLDPIIAQLKLSPPAKILKHDKLSKDAEALVHEVFALQEIIATEAIPALLLAINDELILLNHNFYLQEPKAIIDAIKLEINQQS